MATTLGTEKQERYYGLMVVKSGEVRRLVEEALRNSELVHIICTSQEEHQEAQDFLREWATHSSVGFKGFKAPAGSFRVMWSDLKHPEKV